MNKTLLISATFLLAASLPRCADASTFDFTFSGGGVSGAIDLTYGSLTDTVHTTGYEVTGISGTFSDSNNGLNLVNVPILSLVPINYATPDSTNLLAPHDFSKFPVASGLSAESNGVLTYDNLFYPSGSPASATDYQVHGGFLDIYGLLFNIGNGEVVDFWSNGDFTGTGTGPVSYGAAVATSATALDYVSTGVSVSPEPAALGLLGTGLLSLLAWRKHTARG